MAIKITVSDTVLTRVEGAIVNAEGTSEPFDFKLACRRLDTDALRERVDANIGWAVLVKEVAVGWKGVKGAEGELEFSEANLAQLLAIPGIAMLAANAYVRDCGAKAKN